MFMLTIYCVLTNSFNFVSLKMLCCQWYVQIFVFQLLFICGNVIYLGYEMPVYELSNVNHSFIFYSSALQINNLPFNINSLYDFVSCV